MYQILQVQIFFLHTFQKLDEPNAADVKKGIV